MPGSSARGQDPACFQRVVGLSGRYDLTRQIGVFPDLFDGYYDEDIYFHTPSHFIPNLTDPYLLDRLRSLDTQSPPGRPIRSARTPGT
jgi:esterase/lipase superfamily enzyme